MKSLKVAAAIAFAAVTAMGGVGFAASVEVPRGYAATHSEMGKPVWAGGLTATYLDAVAEPSGHAYDATSKQAEEVKERLHLPLDLSLLPLKEEAAYSRLCSREKQEFVAGHYRAFIAETNNLIQQTPTEAGVETYAAAQKLVRDYLTNDAVPMRNKAALAEYMAWHTGYLWDVVEPASEIINETASDIATKE